MTKGVRAQFFRSPAGCPCRWKHGRQHARSFDRRSPAKHRPIGSTQAAVGVSTAPICADRVPSSRDSPRTPGRYRCQACRPPDGAPKKKERDALALPKPATTWVSLEREKGQGTAFCILRRQLVVASLGIGQITFLHPEMSTADSTILRPIHSETCGTTAFPRHRNLSTLEETPSVVPTVRDE